MADSDTLSVLSETDDLESRDDDIIDDGSIYVLDQWSETDVPFDRVNGQRDDYHDDGVVIGDTDDFRVVEEYRALIKLYRELPKEMCVTHILRNFSSCESDLERVRDSYFDHLKTTCEQFPYEDDAGLKRRMHTRTGDPLAVKLAQDIYSILEVTEGGDPAILKSMISTSRRGKRESVADGPLQNRNNFAAGRVAETCSSCSIEVKLLKDTVLMLQADILTLKQTVHANDKLRNEQSSSLKSSLLGLKQCVLECNTSLTLFTGNTLSAIRGISNSVMQQVMAIEDRVRLLEVVVESEIPNHDERNDVPIYQVNDNEDGELGNSQLNGDSGSPTMYYAQRIQTHNLGPQNTNIVYNAEVVPPFVDHPSEAVATDGLIHTESPAPDSSTSHRPNTIKSAPIPVRVTSRRTHGSGVHDQHIGADAEGFTMPTHRHTKRFCVLGLSRNLNINILANEIQSKGPTISNIRVFPCKRDLSKVVIRLNLIANEHSGCVLENGFWPDYITCRPWVARGRMHRGSQRRELPPRFQAARRENETDWQRDQFAGNRFEPLICEVD